MMNTNNQINSPGDVAVPGCRPAIEMQSGIVNISANNSQTVGANCYLPSTLQPDSPPLVAIHGIGRRADQQADAFIEYAEHTGKCVIAPYFSKLHWPGYQRVVIGKRADLALLDLLKFMRSAGYFSSGTFEFCGYSGGAQYCHRFAMLYPNQVNSLTVCAAGWYTYLDAAKYPYGLSLDGKQAQWSKLIQQRMHEFLSLPITVAVGSEDTQRDESLRQGETIDQQQGMNRVERAERWFNHIVEICQQENISAANKQFFQLPGVAHDFMDCATRGNLIELLPAAQH